jgi:hypothetical protein
VQSGYFLHNQFKAIRLFKITAFDVKESLICAHSAGSKQQGGMLARWDQWWERQFQGHG